MKIMENIKIADSARWTERRERRERHERRDTDMNDMNVMNVMSDRDDMNDRNDMNDMSVMTVMSDMTVIRRAWGHDGRAHFVTPSLATTLSRPRREVQGTTSLEWGPPA